MEEIGLHAGMRDTSEMLAAHPKGVRLQAGKRIEGLPSGFSGHASKATAEIGRQMLKLKVDAAISQIRKLRGARDKVARLR